MYLYLHLYLYLYYYKDNLKLLAREFVFHLSTLAKFNIVPSSFVNNTTNLHYDSNSYV